MNLPGLWREKAHAHPDKVFLYFQDQEITYAQMHSRINQAANQLAARGVGQGDFFSIMQSNAPEFLYTWFALASLGAVTVPINPLFTESEMTYILSHSGAKGIMLEEGFLPLLDKVNPAEVTNLQMIIVNGNPDREGQVEFKELLSGDDSPPLSDINPQDPLVCIYTSGTTDLPKGVLNSHYAWITTGQSYAYTVGIGPEDRVMTPNPLFHANAQVYSTMGSLTAGASLILLPKFSGSSIIEDARKYAATKMVLVQAVTPWVWAREPKPYDSEHHIDTMVAGNVPADIYYDFQERFGLKIQTIYSLTESTMALMGPRNGTQARKPGGIGVPMQHPDTAVMNQVMIVDPEGNPMDPGQKGEIIIKNPATMLGYLNQPEKTAETKVDGWVHTGDLGYQDEDGYVFFVGRLKEVIRRRGELISPPQIEGVINRHEQVKESAVIGVPSGLGEGEEEVMAFIKLEPDSSLTKEQVRDWCAAELAEFKVPRFIEFRDEFEKSAIGRIKKEVLKREVQEGP